VFIVEVALTTASQVVDGVQGRGVVKHCHDIVDLQ